MVIVFVFILGSYLMGVLMRSGLEMFYGKVGVEIIFVFYFIFQVFIKYLVSFRQLCVNFRKWEVLDEY